MKNSAILIALLISSSAIAQGNFASPQWKSLIGKTCANENEFSQLKGFTSLGGTLLSDVNDEEKKSVSLFSKETTNLIFFEVMTNDKIKVIDIVEVTNIQKNQEIKVGTCKDGETDMPGIVALVEQSKQKRWKAQKAWLFNLDKIRVESWPYAKVTCLGIEGDD
jgi:hypothetical protein